MKIDGNALRAGHVISHKGRLWRVAKVQHVKPGKGGAYMQAELKSIETNSKLNERFRASERLQRVHIDSRPAQYLYQEGGEYIFMDQENFEHIRLAKAQLDPETLPFLTDGLVVSVELYDHKPVSAVLPEQMTLSVVDAEAVVKGQTQSGSFKPVHLENGIRIMAPQYIEAGMRVVVRTADKTFVERAQS